MPKKQLTGTIVSDKMMKTVVVEVERLKVHPIYKRRFKVSKKYKAHSETQEFHTGDKVVIEEMKPLSKDKKWKVLRKA